MAGMVRLDRSIYKPDGVAIRVNRGVGEDAGGTAYVDLPDEVSGGVGDKGVASGTDRHVVGHGAVGLVIGQLGKEDPTTGTEVIGGEGVEGRERVDGVDDGEQSVAGWVDGDSLDCDVGREEVCLEEELDVAGVGDGMEGAVAEASDDKAAGCGVPVESLGEEIVVLEGDDMPTIYHERTHY